MVLIFTFISFQSFPQEKQGLSSGYQKQWKQVDSLNNIGLPKSALEVVDKIFSRAKKEKNDPQFLKAIIYRTKLQGDFREDVLESSIRDIKQEIARADEPVKQILNSILGEIYWRYYQNNRHRFSGRTPLWDNDSDSIQTWDLNKLITVASQTYLLSLNNDRLLKTIPITNFGAILETPDKKAEPATALRPTLFDFLSWRALDYFMSNPAPKQISAGAFLIDDASLFAQAEPFSNLTFSDVQDTLSPVYLAVRLFQSLVAFHLSDNDPGALIDEEIQRFAYLQDQSVNNKKDSLYLNALSVLEKSFLTSPYSTDVSFRMAQFLVGQGSLYKPLASDTHKWDVKSAGGICENAIKRFPESQGAKNCKSLLAEIKQPSLTITVESAIVPEKPTPGLISFENVREVYFRLISTNPETHQEKIALMTREEQIKYFSQLTVLRSWSLKLPDDGDLQTHKMEFLIPELPTGYYLLLCSSDMTFSDTRQAIAWTAFFSTNISYISQRNNQDGYDFFILHRETGKPLKNIAVEAFQRTYNYQSRKYESNKTGSFLTDGTGMISIPALAKGTSATNSFLKIRMKEDLLITDNFFQYTPDDRPARPILVTSFFTDRAIYRPGQTVFYKGILLEKTGEKTVLKPGTKTTVTFYDVNYQKIAEKEHVTNEFGSFNGSFIAPSGGLTGQMSITNSSGSATVLIEEYKRPSFEVTFDPLEGNYKLNDSILVTGKATGFAGNEIGGANVSYRVVRSGRFPYRDCWWCPFPPSPETEIINGKIKTLPDGTFSFRFLAAPDLSVDRSYKPVFDYKLIAEVTDINGETQPAATTVTIGYTSLLLYMNIPAKMNLAKDTLFKFSSTNLNGRKTPVSITITFEKLVQPARTFRTRQWERPDLSGFSREEYSRLFPYDVYADEDGQAKWAVEEQIVLTEVNSAVDSIFRIASPKKISIVPGAYRMTMTAKDPSGEAINNIQQITVFDPKSDKVPVSSPGWFVALDQKAEPGDVVKFLAGSKDEDVNMIYEIRVKDSLCTRQNLKINNNQVLVEVPVKEDYRGNFSITVIFVKHNRVFHGFQVIEVPYTNKKLDITYSSMRSKLYPGEEETWKIMIKGATGKGVSSEFLTGMYDASLDAFVPNFWNFSVFSSSYIAPAWNYRGSFALSTGNYFSLHPVITDYQFRQYDQLNWFGFGYYGISRYGRTHMDRFSDKSMRLESKAGAAGISDNLQSPESIQESETTAVESSGEKGIKPPDALSPAKSQATGIQVRRDFRETAFFYPSLLTDTSGNLMIKFTAPESVTRWKVMGLAHTKDLSIGQVEKEVITRKELMVFPNAPRFFRQGDTVIFSVKVANLSDRSLSGEVKLELFDPFTEKPLHNVIVEPIDQTFTIPLGESISKQWKIIIPIDPSLGVIQYRATAIAGNFSDAEEKTIPVLTNRMMVTESMPLPVNGKGIFEFRFDKLLQSVPGKSLKNYKLTLEFASNPAWYAVQALPTLDDPKYPNADNIFYAFYANSLASHIANSNPKIRTVFDAWKNLSPDALLSNLEKNQQLKSALLQETPWVMEARDESSRKQRIALLFDLNNLRNNLSQNLKKLQDLQKESGAWPWFEGMPESRYITQNIITGLGRLMHLGVTQIRKDPATWQMTEKALRYLDGELIRDYEWLKKHSPEKMDENHLGATQIQYLYARSYFEKDLPAASSAVSGEAFRYYKEQAAKYWLKNDQSLQGMIALALNRLGNKEIPGAILKSLSEKALHSKEMGMYWAVASGYEWYQAPVELHALMIEVFEEISSDKNAVDEMKIWLLKQKQTQDWKTSKATVDACYALLMRGTDLLSASPEIKINIGNQTIDPNKMNDVRSEAGTGYFQVNWQGHEITPDMGKITVHKSGEGVAWGALYWQYFEDLDKITSHQTPLKISKKIFVETNTSSGPVLKEILTSANSITTGKGLPVLKTGDKLKIQVIISADRNLGYVHLKDMRAAGFEPIQTTTGYDSGGGLSGYRYQDGLGYYQAATDLAMNFFFDYLPKGTWVLEYPLMVNGAGDYSNGITTIQCMYAPEFGAHSEGVRVNIR